MRYVCIPCRSVDLVDSDCNCRSCGKDVVRIGAYGGWAPPKKTNDRAWKLIERGEYLWDRKRVSKAQAKLPPWLRNDAATTYFFNRAQKKKRSIG